MIAAGKNKVQILYCLIQAFIGMVTCAAVSFATVYMQYKGLSNTHLGYVQAAGMVLGVLVSSWLAAAIDRQGRFTVFHAVWILTGMMGLVFGWLWLTDTRGLLLSVMYSLLLCCAYAIIPMLVQLCFELSNRGLNANFGPARAISSLGYAVISIIMGAVVNKYGEQLVQPAGLGYIIFFGLSFLILCIIVKDVPKAEHCPVSREDSLSTLEFIRANSRFSVLLVGIMIIFFSMNVCCLFLINVVKNIGGDVSTMGGVNSFAAFSEIPAMALFALIARRFKCSSVLRFSLGVYFFKALGMALAPTIGWFYAAVGLQSISYALYVPAMVMYTSLVICQKDAAKGQTLAQSAANIGSCIACAVGGILYDSFSIRSVMLFCSFVCAIGGIICIRSIENTAPSTVSVPRPIKNWGK